MKRNKTEIKFTTIPASDSYDNFAIECRRTRSNINHAVSNGMLNWGEANGIKMIVMDELAESFVARCRAADEQKRRLQKSPAKQG